MPLVTGLGEDRKPVQLLEEKLSGKTGKEMQLFGSKQPLEVVTPSSALQTVPGRHLDHGVRFKR